MTAASECLISVAVVFVLKRPVPFAGPASLVVERCLSVAMPLSVWVCLRSC